ncbi:MAG: hypothetical protein Q4E54_02935 [Lachnospiraceae bacterium]|nr:hypothetical protein [Lachnospiraceae bacterium]
MSTVKKNKQYQMQASFTVEAAMVMGIILICLVTAIIFAYRCRDGVFRNYVAGEAALMTAHTEETWLTDLSETEAIEQYAHARLSVLGRYTDQNLSLSRDRLSETATARHGDEEYTAKIADIENYMRLSSVIKDFVEKKEKDDGS